MKKYIILGSLLFIPFISHASAQLFWLNDNQGYDLTGQLQAFCLGDGSCYDVKGVQLNGPTANFTVPSTPTTVPIENHFFAPPPAIPPDPVPAPTVLETPTTTPETTTSTPTTEIPIFKTRKITTIDISNPNLVKEKEITLQENPGYDCYLINITPTPYNTSTTYTVEFFLQLKS